MSFWCVPKNILLCFCRVVKVVELMCRGKSFDFISRFDVSRQIFCFVSVNYKSSLGRQR
jgi:hypothetical protein